MDGGSFFSFAKKVPIDKPKEIQILELERNILQMYVESLNTSKNYKHSSGIGHTDDIIKGYNNDLKIVSQLITDTNAFITNELALANTTVPESKLKQLKNRITNVKNLKSFQSFTTNQGDSKYRDILDKLATLQTPPQAGGSQTYYNKYMKYKQKYLNLKNKI